MIFNKLFLIAVISCILAFNQANAFGLKSSWRISHDYWKNNIVRDCNQTECVFFASEKVLSCGSSLMPVVDCEASSNFTDLDVSYFGSFGVGIKSNADLKIPSTDMFNLYPRIKSYPGYMSNIVSLDGRMGHFHLNWNRNFNTYGIVVQNQTCFSKLIDMFVSMKDSVKECELKSFLMEKPRFKHITDLYVVA